MSAPSPRAGWWARRRSRSCWRRRSSRSSAATPSPRRVATSTRSCQGCGDGHGDRGGPHVIVYLVGMPGSGKSTVGPELARRLGVPFVELDERIEHAARSSVREIFERDVERLFRDREPLYREFAAHVVDASGPVEDVATAIEKELLRWSA